MSAQPITAMPSAASNLTGGRLLARNTMINLGSSVLPLLVAIFAIPPLVHRLGVERYGVIAITTMVGSYFGLLDLGLGRAATKFISEAAGDLDNSKIPEIFWSSLCLMLGIGVLAGILVLSVAPWLVHHVFKIPLGLRGESTRAFLILAFSMPLVISNGCLNGTLASFQRFDLINAIAVPVGIFSYLGPLAVLPFSHNLALIFAVLVIGRFVGWSVSLWLCIRVAPSLFRNCRPRWSTLRPLLVFGTWVTVSAVINPLTLYLDRFFIGAVLSMAAVAYYAVPYQVAGKLWIIPASVNAVTFPAFASTIRRDGARAAQLLESANKYTLLVLFLPTLLIITLAPEALRLWMGAAFADHSTTTLRWLAFAAFINGLAHPGYGLIQAANRPDLTAKIHLAEVPLYIPLLWLLLARYGVVGVSIGWTLRVIATTVVVFAMAQWLVPSIKPALVRMAIFVSAASLAFALATLPSNSFQKEMFLAAMLPLFMVSAWLALEPREKHFVIGYLRSIGPSPA